MSNDSICRSHFDERVRRVVSVDKELSADYLDGVDMVLYLLSTEPTVPQEMSAAEYIHISNRMLKKDYRAWDRLMVFEENDDADKAIAWIKEWAWAHPEEVKI